MATDHTKHYGEFEGIKREDTSDVAADKATEILNSGNGDVHGINVDQKEMAAEADDAGAEELRNPFGAEAFKALHNTQAGQLAMGAGANAGEHGQTRAKILAEQKETNRQNNMTRMTIMSAFSLTMAQELALGRISGFTRGLRESQQQIETAASSAAELRDERDQILETETNPEIRERIEEHYRDRIASANTALADGLQSREEQMEGFINNFDEIASPFAEGDTDEAKAEHVDQMRENFVQFAATGNEEFLEDMPPALRAQIAQEFSGIEFSPEQLQAFDDGNLSLSDALAEQGVNLSEAMPRTIVAAQTAAEMNGAPICATTVEHMELFSSQLDNGEIGTAPPTPANEAVAPSSERAAVSPDYSSPFAVSDLEGPADHASVAGMIDIPNSFGEGRMTTVYANGTISDGAFQDARTGITTPVPGNQPDFTPTPTDPNANNATFKDPLTERLERGMEMNMAAAAGF